MAISRKYKSSFLFLLLSIFLCLPGLAKTTNGPTQMGIASWYGIKFQGRTTSSGEIYDRHQLTAAHKTLPLQTIVKVTNLTTKKSVIVRINDRGPFVGKRIIDLSEAAAKEIGYRNHGLTNVKVEVLEFPRSKSGKLILPKRGFAAVENKPKKPVYSYRFVNPEVSRVEARAYLTKAHSPFLEMQTLSSAAVSPDRLMLDTWKLFSTLDHVSRNEGASTNFSPNAGWYAARGEAALGRKKPLQSGVFALMMQVSALTT
jgi:hypothetical protein